MMRLAALVALAALLACDDNPTESAPIARNVLFTLGLVDDGEIWDMKEDGTIEVLSDGSRRHDRPCG